MGKCLRKPNKLEENSPSKQILTPSPYGYHVAHENTYEDLELKPSPKRQISKGSAKKRAGPKRTVYMSKTVNGRKRKVPVGKQKKSGGKTLVSKSTRSKTVTETQTDSCRQLREGRQKTPTRKSPRKLKQNQQEDE